MPDNKRHHYVPRFLLKKFSVRAEGKSIYIYNIKSQRLICGGSLKGQAYKDYLYGRDGRIEKALSDLEYATSIIVYNITNNNSYPSVEEFITLLMFVLMLHGRTLYSADQLDEITDMLAKKFLMASNNMDIVKHLDQIKIKTTNPMSLILSKIAMFVPLAFDLHMKILRNVTAIDFIISDNPVIYYNRFLENRKTYGSNVGIAVKGLQIFLPISPRYTLFFFDSDIYSVGKKEETILDVGDSYDINGLNYLQFVSGYNNIYFNENITDNYIRESVARTTKYRNVNKAEINEYPHMVDPQRSLLHVYGYDIKTNLNLSFSRITKRAKSYQLGNRAVHVRDEETVKVFKEFSSAVKKGEYAPNEFYSFLRDKEKEHE
jgi:hypothetical protein